jgi:hypothetical protein
MVALPCKSVVQCWWCRVVGNNVMPMWWILITIFCYFVLIV